MSCIQLKNRMKKIDITSTAVEKGIDFAKDFLDKLIIPTIEETGLLLKDKVTLWRFKNQIKMLNKTREYCLNNNISPKTISLKLLCPLLENASLEDNEVLQEKWSILLGNMVDSEQNIENHVFPALLGQISIVEFMTLENAIKSKVDRIENLSKKLVSYRKKNEENHKILKNRLIEIEKEINERNKINISEPNSYKGTWNLQNEKMEINSELNQIVKKEKYLSESINNPEKIYQENLKEFEISNLVRLGLIKEIINPYAYINSHDIRNDPNSEYLTIEDVEVQIENDKEDYILTALGNLFINACTKKR